MSYRHHTVQSFARVMFPRTGARVVVPVAITLQDRIRGLLGVTHLHTDEGMLFMVPEDEPVSMTMRGMLVPLDFLFLDGKRVCEVHHGVPADFPDPVRPVSVPWVPLVLEMRAGFAYDRVILPGDPVHVEMLVDR